MQCYQLSRAQRTRLLSAPPPASPTGSDLSNSLPTAQITATSDPTAPAPPEENGDRIGPYRLIRKIGEGGMSTVYLADRADEAFQLFGKRSIGEHHARLGDVLLKITHDGGQFGPQSDTKSTRAWTSATSRQ